MDSELITLTMTREQYNEMIYAMKLSRKMRISSLDRYYKKRERAPPADSETKKCSIPIPTIENNGFVHRAPVRLNVVQDF